MGLLGRIVSIIITTFMFAILYGLFCVTVDVLGAHYNPVQSGHRAATNIYSLFGTVSTEAQRNDATAKPGTNAPSIAARIAAPYAVTADVAAILGGKLEIAISHLFNGVETKTEPAHPAPAATEPR